MRKLIILIGLITFISCAQEVNFDNYVLEMLNKHNAYRELHHAGHLTYNNDLAKIAYEQTERIYTSTQGGFFYSNSTYNGQTLGESFFYCNTYDDTTCLLNYDVTSYWYKEYYSYCYSTKAFPNSSRNFITMVWKETTSMGCAMNHKILYDIVNAYLVVCVYYPGVHPYKGPTPEQFDENVLERTDGNKNSNPC